MRRGAAARLERDDLRGRPRHLGAVPEWPAAEQQRSERHGGAREGDEIEPEDPDPDEDSAQAQGNARGRRGKPARSAHEEEAAAADTVTRK